MYFSIFTAPILQMKPEAQRVKYFAQGHSLFLEGADSN